MGEGWRVSRSEGRMEGGGLGVGEGWMGEVEVEGGGGGVKSGGRVG